MMSITETSVVAGVATFLFYGLVPVAIILYIGGSRRRRIKRQLEDEARRNAINSAGKTTTEIQETEEGNSRP